MYPLLEKYRDDIYKCIRCGACRAVCPTFAAELDETMTARGRMALVEAVLDGKLPLTDRFVEKMSTCIGCMACSADCPSGVPVEEIILAVRAEIARSRGMNPLQKLIARNVLVPGWLLGPLSRIGGLTERVLRPFSFLSPFQWKGMARKFPDISGLPLRDSYPEVVRPKGEVKGRVAFYVGCNINLVYTDIGRSMISLLTRLGIEVVMPSDEVCCGAPLLGLGERETVIDLAAKNLQAFANLDVDAIVLGCPTCGHMLKKYPEMVAEARPELKEEAEAFAAKVMDINDYLLKFTDITSLLANAGLDQLRVTYHDPCHLKRGMGISKEPRSLIGTVPGVTLAEMSAPDRCCGFGGTFSLSHYDLSMKVGEMKAEDIRGTDAELVITSCPGCRMGLEDLLDKSGQEIPVKHVVQLLDEALKGQGR
ncbi:MAG: (Fe-S)-binding protein [Nitrospirota bacterium]|nr:(Fe-S)-binding protein [Nitrospirota bacterium]